MGRKVLKWLAVLTLAFAVSGCAKGKDNIHVQTKPLLAMIKSPWKKFLSVDAQESEAALLESTNEPAGQ